MTSTAKTPIAIRRMSDLQDCARSARSYFRRTTGSFCRIEARLQICNRGRRLLRRRLQACRRANAGHPQREQRGRQVPRECGVTRAPGLVRLEAWTPLQNQCSASAVHGIGPRNTRITQKMGRGRRGSRRRRAAEYADARRIRAAEPRIRGRRAAEYAEDGPRSTRKTGRGIRGLRWPLNRHSYTGRVFRVIRVSAARIRGPRVIPRHPAVFRGRVFAICPRPCLPRAPAYSAAR